MAAVPREYQDYVIAWIGRNLFFTDGGLGGIPQTGIQVSTGLMLPPNAVVIQIIIAVIAAFNGTTTNTLDVGSAAAPQALVANQTIAATGTFILTPPAASGGVLSSTAPVEIFTRYNFLNPAPTTGLGRIAVKFIVDPDRRK